MIKLIVFFNRAFRRIKMLLWYRFFLKRSGKGALILKPILLTPDCLSLGDKVFIRNNARIEGVFSAGNQSFTPNILISNNVNIEQNVHLTCADSIIIGENTAIAANVSITDIGHTYEDITLSPKFQPLTFNRVEIGADCTIYNNSVILPGTILGKHCTVAANSVVSGKFPDYSLIGGIPAKILKRYNANTKSWQRTNSEGIITP